MAAAIPSIACLGVIGRNNNPLHITIFPSYDFATNKRAPLRTPLQFSLLLSSTLDVFEARRRASNSASSQPGAGSAASAAPIVTGDFGLLHAVDERLAAYGFETNTGVKFVAVVDMRGRFAASSAAGFGSGAGGGSGGDRTMSMGVGAGVRGGVGLREQELRVVFRAMQTAYVRLLQNPFYDPDEHAPLVPAGGGGSGGKRITSRKFAEEMRRIGEGWAPGVASL
ncbi:snare-like protein [Annulohypoxylon maeteangense]|uniref:snare-like protein n=1 Tax=Annulohypoxylon maeteangense TaxID=1927788 RepID=UPI00200888BA|nr:snare-like protein [Annulohypoxylon maeteangense]KAI0881654.1 snare-like protein [Annulohypoxylon maeteangense]